MCSSLMSIRPLPSTSHWTKACMTNLVKKCRDSEVMQCKLYTSHVLQHEWGSLWQPHTRPHSFRKLPPCSKELPAEWSHWRSKKALAIRLLPRLAAWKVTIRVDKRNNSTKFDNSPFISAAKPTWLPKEAHGGQLAVPLLVSHLDLISLPLMLTDWSIATSTSRSFLAFCSEALRSRTRMSALSSGWGPLFRFKLFL